MRRSGLRHPASRQVTKTGANRSSPCRFTSSIHGAGGLPSPGHIGHDCQRQSAGVQSRKHRQRLGKGPGPGEDGLKELAAQGVHQPGVRPGGTPEEGLAQPVFHRPDPPIAPVTKPHPLLLPD